MYLVNIMHSYRYLIIYLQCPVTRSTKYKNKYTVHVLNLAKVLLF